MSRQSRHDVGYEWGMFAPPWSDHYQDYGPVTKSGYERAVARYEFSLEGHGFWDFEQEDRMVGVKHMDPKPARSVARQYDIEKLRAYVDAHSDSIPKGELSVYVYLLKGHSIRHAARELGVRRETVRCYLKRLEKRIEGRRA